MKNRILIFIFLMVLVSIQGCKKDSPIESIPPEGKVEITSPTNNASVFDLVEIHVSASSGKSIVKVELYIDGEIDSSKIIFTPPYIFAWNIADELDSTTHTLQAKAFESDNTVLNSAIVKVTSYKVTPSDLQILSINESAISLSWKNNSRIATGFLIEESIRDSSFALVDSVGPNDNSITIKGPFDANTNYSFRVRAKTDTAFSRYSNIATTQIPFKAPLLEQISSMNDSTITISWQDTSNMKKTFEIEQSVDGVSFQIVQTINATLNETHYTTSLTARYSLGQLYFFRVRTRSLYNLSPYSDVKSTDVAFESPIGLKILSSTIYKIVLKWSNLSRFTSTFSIERQVGSQAFIEIGSVNASILTFADSTLDASVIYHYRIRAKNGNYSSGYSNSLAVQFKYSNGYKRAFTINAHTNEVGSVAFASNDQIFISGSGDHTVKLWDVNSGNLLRIINLGESVLWSKPALSTFNNLLAVCYSMNNINIYDVTNGNLVKTLRTSDGNLISGLAFSPDGKYLGALNSGSFTVWRVSDWTIVMTKNGDLQYAVAFSSDNQFVVLGSNSSGSATVYKMSTQAISTTLSPGGFYPIMSLAISPDNKNIAITGFSTQVVVYPAIGGTPTKELNYHALPIRCLVYSLTGNLLAVGGDNNTIDIWKQGTLSTSISEPGTITSLAFSRDARFLVAGNADHNIRLYFANGTWEGS